MQIDENVLLLNHDTVGIADGELYWNAYLRQWQVWVNFADGCRSVVYQYDSVNNTLANLRGSTPVETV